MSKSVYLWFEAVDFYQSLSDTSKLPIMRGASIAMLEAPVKLHEWLRGKAPDGDIEAELIFAGASQGLLELKVASMEQAEAIMQQALAAFASDEITTTAQYADGQDLAGRPLAVFSTLSFVYGLAEISDDAAAKDRRDAVELAKMRAKLAQLQGQPRRKALEPSDRVCAFNRNLPANRTINGIDNGKDIKIHVSDSVEKRRQLGVDARQTLFGRLLVQSRDLFDVSKVAQQELEAAGKASQGLQFATDFETILDNPPEPNNLPVSLKGKFAIFYADGNKFGRLRDAAGGDPASLKSFSNKLQDLQVGKLMGQLLHWLTKHEHARTLDGQLAFETLLWGGDELMFVMPSWLGIEFAQKFFEWTADENWVWNGERMTFGAGLLFAPRKSPIKDLSAYVHDLGDCAKSCFDKGHPYGQLQIDVLESQEIPRDGPAAHRYRLLGVKEEDQQWLTMHATAPDKTKGSWELSVLRIVDDLKAQAFPRSQIYKALRSLPAQSAIFSQAADIAVKSSLEFYRAGAGSSFSGLIDGLVGPKPTVDLATDLENLKQAPARCALKLYLVASLWDYVNPLNVSRQETGANEEAAQ